jgi:hypothetical protein
MSGRIGETGSGGRGAISARGVETFRPVEASHDRIAGHETGRIAMRNLKPSQAALRREGLDFDLPPEPAPPRCLVARIEDISGFDPEQLPQRATRISSGRHSTQRLALLATASLAAALIAAAAVVPGLLAR